jgi:hypothetical protein
MLIKKNKIIFIETALYKKYKNKIKTTQKR